MQKNTELIRRIIEDIEADATDEEIIHQLLEQKVSDEEHYKRLNTYTFGERAADRLAAFAGSWKFIGIFTFCLVFWMALNILFLVKAFDPYPFILLNLVLSCLAAVQAPLIMMSQNRQEQKDRIRAENDYKVNLKTEIIIEDLHSKMDTLAKNQKKIMDFLELQNTQKAGKE